MFSPVLSIYCNVIKGFVYLSLSNPVPVAFVIMSTAVQFHLQIMTQQVRTRGTWVTQTDQLTFRLWNPARNPVTGFHGLWWVVSMRVSLWIKINTSNLQHSFSENVNVSQYHVLLLICYCASCKHEHNMWLCAWVNAPERGHTHTHTHTHTSHLCLGMALVLQRHTLFMAECRLLLSGLNINKSLKTVRFSAWFFLIFVIKIVHKCNNFK